MISDVMVYGGKVALLIGLAALALEQVAAWRGFPRRGLWAAALVLSLALPALGLLVPKPAMALRPSVINPSLSSVAEPRVVTRESRAADTAASTAIKSQPQQRHLTRLNGALLEQVLLTIWVASPAGLLIFYAHVWLRLRMVARHWRREQIDDQVVWVTEALGPAVWGFIKPVMLMPQWVLDAPTHTRALVFAHEREHIAARDPAMLLLGLVLVVIAPWNILLWWQLQRLRFAIEVDCDARVLRRGGDATAYGEMLLAVGERRTLMPVGAIALTEPASQLLRRIRILTADLPKRGKWAVAAAVGLSVASLAVAAEFQAPVLRVSSISQEAVAVALRKPPVGEDPRLADVQNLVRATYPEMFNASAPPGSVLVTLLLNQDGTLYKSFKEDIEPTPWVATSLRAIDAMGVDYEHGARVKLRMEGSATARNRIDVLAWYRESSPDPSRDVAIVRPKVRARYGTFFRPIYADGSRVFRDGSSLVTVFMTEAGDIDRAEVAASKDLEVDKDVDGQLQALATPERFVAMGIERARIGLIGTTKLYAGYFLGDRDVKTLLVIYAWPRRPNEPGPTHEPPEQPAAAKANDNPAVNREIAEHYFPDLYTFPKEWPRADPWVLLDRLGRVLTTGRRVVMSARDIQLYVESLYPGIRTDGVQVTTVQGGPGQSADVGFVWLAADSPVSDLSKADLSARSALLVYADVIGEGMTRPTELMALKVGSPAVTVCSLKNPFGVVHVQITAVEIGTDAMTARIRVQHAPLPATAEIPRALETGWSPESPLVRAPFGGSTDVQVIDQDGKAWKIVLHSERVGSGRS
jgi:beta-lactamase regulating signal transducer with metallopeptidase domain